MYEAVMAIFKDEMDEKMAASRAEGRLLHAKETALNLRDMTGMNDAATIARIVGVETELVERWFAE